MAASQVVFQREAQQVSSSESAVSWSAVLGGAAVAAALSVILIALGAGLGLSSVSPWSNSGTTVSTIGKVGIGWMILTQSIASAMGGYLAGRLRTKWRLVHTDEIYFRDTAHGFLVWAIGVIVAASLLGSAAVAMTGTSPNERANPNGSASVAQYYVGALLRTDHPGTPADPQTTAEIEAILAHSLTQGDLAATDKQYLATLVSARTNLSPADAQNRVNTVVTNLREAEDQARKATAHLLLWTFLALLIGAFCASFAATIGGKQRDLVKASDV